MVFHHEGRAVEACTPNGQAGTAGRCKSLIGAETRWGRLGLGTDANIHSPTEVYFHTSAARPAALFFAGKKKTSPNQWGSAL